MADNVVLNAGSGGDTLRTVDRSGSGPEIPVSIIDVGTGATEALIGDPGIGMPTRGLAAENAAVVGNPILVGGRFDSSPRTLGTGDVGAIALDADGAVQISDGGNSITVDNGGTFVVQSTLQAGTAEIGKLAAGVAEIGNVKNSGTFVVQSTLQAGTAEIGKLAAGVAEIGNVKNSGTFVTQATLQAGTAAFGKLSANSGTDIGDVDVTSIIPGVGATNLGKAEDAAHASGDTGVAILGVHRLSDDTGIEAGLADGDYAIPLIDTRGRMKVSPGALHILDNMNSATGWAAIDTDTTNLATTLDHLLALNALTFDKENTAANNVLAMIEKTITSINVFNLVTGALFLQAFVKITGSTADVVNVVMRLGTDSSNYNTWKIDGTGATADKFESFRTLLANNEGSTGNGVNLTAVTYIAVGIEFSAETDVRTGIIFDGLILTAGQVHSADSTSDIVSQTVTPNVNIQKVGNKIVDKEAGNVSTGTQRFTIATDDVNLAAIKTAAEISDNVVKVDDAAFALTTDSVSMAGAIRDDSLSNLAAAASDAVPLRVDIDGALWVIPSGTTVVSGTVTANPASGTIDTVTTVSTVTNLSQMGGVAISLGDGVSDTGTQRVTLSSDGTGVLSVDDNGGSLTIDNTDITTIAGAVTGTEMQVDIVTDLPKAATVDNFGAALMTNVIHSGTTALTPAFASIDAANNGDNTLVAAGTNKIRVLSLMMVAAGTVTVRFESGTAGSFLSGEMNLVANTGFVLPFNPVGWFETASAALLNMQLSAGVSVDGVMTYVDVA